MKVNSLVQALMSPVYHRYLKPKIVANERKRQYMLIFDGHYGDPPIDDFWPERLAVKFGYVTVTKDFSTRYLVKKKKADSLRNEYESMRMAR